MYDLQDMLSYCRPAGSKMEDQFLAKYLAPLDPKVDAMGNYIITVGDKPEILWSSHYDTVHRTGKRQKVKLKGGQFVATSRHSNCLGADDTAGVWLMLELIHAKTPGVYVFHYGEEQGCIGSRWLAENNEELLKSVNATIALDRRGFKSMVTHQCQGRCASDAFAEELSKRIGLGHIPDPGGIWTDNVEYQNVVAENVNLSVGYLGQHGDGETQDYAYIKTLRDALIGADLTGLPIERDPTIADWGYSSGGKGYSNLSGNTSLMADLISDNPKLVARWLHSYGFDEDDLIDEITTRDGDLQAIADHSAKMDDWYEHGGGYAG